MSNRLTAEGKRKQIKLLKIFGGASVLLVAGLAYYQYYTTQQTMKNTKKSSSCCGGGCNKSEIDESKLNDQDDSKFESQKKMVQERYSATARNFESNSASDQEKIRSMAEVFGYTKEELAEIGKDANLGLGCGNPVKQANLKKGEIVLDLGCGAGMDLFLAKKYIGDSKDGGQLLGVDFSKDMLQKAQKNADKKSKRGQDTSNMKFMFSEIENMKAVINNDSVDCVISNCVLNLIPNKLAAFKEIYRVLKPNGGRICLSDIALKQPLPELLQTNMTSIANCVGGACLAKEYKQLLLKAGFKSVEMIDKNVNINVWKDSWEGLVGGNDGEPKQKSGGCCGGGGGDNNNEEEEVIVIKDKKDIDGGGGGGCCGSSKASVSCCGGGDDDLSSKISDEEKKKVRQLLAKTNLNDYVASYYVFGFK